MSTADALSRKLWDGPGWRVGWNPTAPKFTAMIGSDSWSLELTTAEIADVCRLSGQLAATMAALAHELMDEERVTCEQETAQIWLEAEGFPQQYDLRIILLTGRGGEGSWTAAAVPHLLAALASLKDLAQL